jgi:hypothetical protein
MDHYLKQLLDMDLVDHLLLFLEELVVGYIPKQLM